MLRRVLLIVAREVRVYVADWGDLAFSLLLPLVLLGLMLGAFGGDTQFSGTAYIVDNDGGAQARALLDRLEAAPGLTVERLGPDEARRRLDDSAILLYHEIPAGFSARLEGGEPAGLVRYQRGNGGQEGQIVGALVQDAAGAIGAEARLQARVGAVLDQAGVSVPPEQVRDAVAESMARAQDHPPVTVAVETVGGEQTDLAAIFFPNIASWFVLFAVSLNAQSFVRERREGTLERLLTTRLRRGEFLIGKFLGNGVRAIIQFAVLFVVGTLVFDFLTPGALARSLVFAILVSLAVGALGTVIGVIARTPDQAIWIGVFATMAMAVFGGTFFAGEVGGLLGTVARGTITYWAGRGFHALIIDGAGLGEIALPIVVMLGVAVVALGASRLLFRPRAGSV